jgi:hypothetical protein
LILGGVGGALNETFIEPDGPAGNVEPYGLLLLGALGIIPTLGTLAFGKLPLGIAAFGIAALGTLPLGIAAYGLDP